MVNKTRLRSDFNLSKTYRLHKDGIQAMEVLINKFKGAYTKKQLATFAFLHLEKAVKQSKLKAGDDLETILGI